MRRQVITLKDVGLEHRTPQEQACWEAQVERMNMRRRDDGMVEFTGPMPLQRRGVSLIAVFEEAFARLEEES